MNQENLRQLLASVQSGDTPVEDALDSLRQLPYEDLGFARVDHHRALRTGHPEVIFAEGKTASQVAKITQVMVERGTNTLVTRLAATKWEKLRPGLLEALEEFSEGALREDSNLEEAWTWHYDELGRTLAVRPQAFVDHGRGWIAVVCAGTSDLPVGREALVTAHMLGNRVELITDVGVAGLHRLLDQREKLSQAEVIITVAGMEGALSGVLAGLVDRPVLGVPTSVGYGASFGGLSALLTMLNSCAAGLAVVNIDNGFGAAVAASQINRNRS